MGVNVVTALEPGSSNSSPLLLLGLLPEELLGLRVVHQDLRQVLLVQDEEVGEAMRLHVGCAPVASAPRQQTDQ